MGETPTPLTPWGLLRRLEERVRAERGARLTWETTDLVVRALRAYVANPKRDELARVICMRKRLSRQSCAPLCRECRDLAYELKCMMQGEPDVFGDRGWYDGGHRKHEKR